MAAEKLIDITDDQIGAIYDSGKDATVSFIRTLIDKINELSKTVERQQIEINELKAIIAKDSHNSSKPPSSDNPFRKMTKSLRKKGGKSGGQKGHKGFNLKKSNNPDIIKKLLVQGKCGCGRCLSSGNKTGVLTRQVVDFQEIKPITTEYQAEMVECVKCGEVHVADFPPDVKANVQYGQNIKSLIVSLKCHGFVSYERISEFFTDVIGLKMSQGTLVNIVNECAAILKPAVDKIKEELKKEPVVHFDETGLKINNSLHWLHSAGNNKYTFYFPYPKRGKAAMDAADILPHYKGIAVHDHWESYYNYTKCDHSLCNSHHLRELIFFEEQDEGWAGKIKECLLAAKMEKDKNPKLPRERIRFYRVKLLRQLNAGLKIHPKEKAIDKKRGRVKQSKAHNLLIRMKNRIDDVLRFTMNPSVPFDNNSAERDIRMTKVQQKVSGTFRSSRGAINFAIIRSYISTVRKHGLSVFKAIANSMRNFDGYSIFAAE